MQGYEKKTAQKSAQQNTAAPMQAKTNGIPNSALADVFSGKRQADSSMMGHSKNLAPSIAAKMSQAFGMDLSGMQVYSSDAMVGSGMQGMAQGNKVVLSSDVNLNTMAGQAVLGHELSHIRAQSQGIGTGHSGLYENAALEHQADTEGLLAAQGRSIYSDGAMDMGLGMQYGLGMQGVENITTLGSGMSVSAGAPMQAKKDDMKVNTGLLKEPGKEKTSGGGLFEKMENARMGFLKKQFGISDEQFAQMKPRKKTTQLERIQKLFNKGKKKTPSPVNPTFDEPTVLPNLEDIKSDADPLGTKKKTPSPVNPLFDEPTVLPNLEEIKSDADPLGVKKKPMSMVNPLFDEPTVLPNLEDIKSDADPLGVKKKKTGSISLIDDDDKIPQTVNESLIDDDEELNGTTPFDDDVDEKKAKDEEVFNSIMNYDFKGDMEQIKKKEAEERYRKIMEWKF